MALLCKDKKEEGSAGATPDIYSICFSQLDGDKDSLLLDGGFSFLIAVRLIRDNWKAVIKNYPTSLIGEIWFDLHDK